jgi:hypothetical protein
VVLPVVGTGFRFEIGQRVVKHAGERWPAGTRVHVSPSASAGSSRGRHRRGP